jgi:hypothetical protein
VTRKENDWFKVQTIRDPKQCQTPSTISPKPRLTLPKKPEEWLEMDTTIANSFDTLLEVARPDGAESELSLLKETIYADFAARFGIKDFTTNTKRHRNHNHVAEEKKLRNTSNSSAGKGRKIPPSELLILNGES